MEDHPLSAIRYGLFNILASYPPNLQAVFFIRNLGSRKVFVTMIQE
jgi:hypothetical protein